MPRCDALVSSGMGWRANRCSHPGKVEVDGKHFCGIHNPNKLPSKSQQRSELIKAQRRNRREFESDAIKLVRELAKENHPRAHLLVDADLMANNYIKQKLEDLA